VKVIGKFSKFILWYKNRQKNFFLYDNIMVPVSIVIDNDLR